jgi:hypothetical protein
MSIKANIYRLKVLAFVGIVSHNVVCPTHFVTALNKE